MPRLPRLTLLQTFSVVSLLVIAALGVTLGTVLHARIEHRALDDARRLAVTVARVGAAGQLRDGEPNSGPLSSDRIAALDHWFSSSGLLRGKLYDRRGRVAWSDDHAFIGRNALTRGDVRAALDGHIDALVEEDAEELGAEGRFFEVYVPIHGGVFESYSNYEPTARAITSDTRILVVTLVAGLLLLWLALFRVVARASRRLRHQATHDRAHGPAQPQRPARARCERPRRRPAPRHAGRAPAHRPRPLQGGQRHAGARAGRPAPRRRRSTPPRRPATRRRPGPPGRRRVRHPRRPAAPRRARRDRDALACRARAPVRRGRRRHRARRVQRNRPAARPRTRRLDAAAPRRRGHV